MSIYSGIIGDDKINCHKAFEMVMKSVKSVVGENYETVKFTRKNRVLSIKTVQSSIKVNDQSIAIDPLLLFQLLCLNMKSKSDMRNYLKFELLVSRYHFLPKTASAKLRNRKFSITLPQRKFYRS